jgi:hypothetical protein
MDKRWSRIPTCRRYLLDRKRYVEVRGKLVRLPDLTEADVAALEIAHAPDDGCRNE